MNKSLRVLQIEDSESDAALIVRLLEKAGHEIFSHRVESAAEFKAALDGQPWDVIIADYRLPQFDAPSALRVLRQTGLDTPFLVVSGTIGEDVAVEIMKAGAHDYLMKDQLTRLAPAVEREIREAKMRHRRREAEEAVRRNEERYRTVLETSLDGFCVIDGEGRLLDVTQAYCRLVGYSREELLQMRVLDLDVSLDAAAVAQRIREAAQWGSGRFETRHRRKDGRIVDVEVSTTHMPHDGTQCAFVRDITARKRADAALRESEERYRRVVEGAPDGIFVQTDSRFRYLNPAALAMFGADDEDQIAGRPVLERIHPDFHAVVTERLRVLLQEKRSVPLIEERYLRLDGTVFDVEVASVPITSDGCAGSIVFFRDITARKRAERERASLANQLQQAQRLESVGRLAGGVAHDFNNLLTVINGYGDLLFRQLGQDDPLRKPVGEMRKAGERAAELTRQLLAFGRKQIIEPRPMNLNRAITDSLDLLHRLLGEDIDLETRLAPRLGCVVADPAQVNQILMNLVVNARDAMPGGGRLVIETANAELDPARLSGDPEMPPGPYVMLSVTDSGAGIPEEDRQRIFEPFFTTKTDGRSTGLGLSTVYGIVRQAGGSISVDSEPGRGSTFTILLPRSPEPAAPETPPAIAPAVPRGKETVLVVEDMEDVRSFISVILRDNGYRVLEAAAGPDALRLAGSYSGPIHLMLSDVVMPRMTGRELADRLRPQRPEMKVIYLSGYPADTIARRGVLEAGVAYLAKPFSPESLAAKVREVLGPPAA